MALVSMVTALFLIPSAYSITAPVAAKIPTKDCYKRPCPTCHRPPCHTTRRSTDSGPSHSLVRRVDGDRGIETDGVAALLIRSLRHKFDRVTPEFRSEGIGFGIHRAVKEAARRGSPADGTLFR